jgi:hypothetical protein
MPDSNRDQVTARSGSVTVVQNQVLSEHMVHTNRSREGTDSGGWASGEQNRGVVRGVARMGGGETSDAWVGDGQV